MAKQYRALVKLEWPDPDKKGKYVVINAGDEFDEPPKEANIAALIKGGSVELVGSGKEKA